MVKYGNTLKIAIFTNIKTARTRKFDRIKMHAHRINMQKSAFYMQVACAGNSAKVVCRLGAFFSLAVSLFPFFFSYIFHLFY